MICSAVVMCTPHEAECCRIMRRPGDRIDRHQFFVRPALKLTDVMAGLGPLTAMSEPQHDPSARAESARYCPQSTTWSRRGADDPDPERCPVPLPAGDHLDADRCQLPGVPVPGQPGPR